MMSGLRVVAAAMTLGVVGNVDCCRKDAVSVKTKLLTCGYLGHSRGGWCLVIAGGTVGDGRHRRQ